jgi:hypothetical protein
MSYEEDPERLNQKIRADGRYAQIFIRMTDSQKSEKEAEKIVESLGIHIISKSVISEDWILFKLDVNDMREAALRLTEHGFSVKGINALP